MRKHLYILPWITAIFLISCANGWAVAASVFDDAVAVWHMADLNDSAGKNSRLTIQDYYQDKAKCGIELQGAEREASLRRGGDGYVAWLDGGWLDAGQGADGELRLSGNAMTMALRVRTSSGQWGCPLFGKQGSLTRVAYSIFSENGGSHGANPMLVAELGSNEVWGMHLVKTSLANIGPTDWHDFIVRFDGKNLQLFVDGSLRDDEVAVSTLRSGNLTPCLIGAESYETVGDADSNGKTDASRAVKSSVERPDIVFESFENGNYHQWTVEGEAFGKQPSKAQDNPHPEPMKNWGGDYLADSFLKRSDTLTGDTLTGKLTSVPFTISRRSVVFRIAGGTHAGRTCINLLVDGKVLRTATGESSETLIFKAWNVSELEGKQARLEIVDTESSGWWGHVMVDDIVFTDREVKPDTFRGLVDHVALWNRALSDAEIAHLSGVSAVADKRPHYYGEKYRPQFHFTAQKHWINDPNGSAIPGEGKSP